MLTDDTASVMTSLDADDRRSVVWTTADDVTERYDDVDVYRASALRHSRCDDVTYRYPIPIEVKRFKRFLFLPDFTFVNVFLNERFYYEKLCTHVAL